MSNKKQLAVADMKIKLKYYKKETTQISTVLFLFTFALIHC